MAALWWHEIRRGGPAVLALPLVVAVAVGAVAAAVGGFGGRVLVGHAIPVVAGFAAASIVAGEAMVELHLTVSTPYRVTVARRLGLLMLTTLLGTALLVGIVAWRGFLEDPAAVAVGVTAFSAAMVALGALAAAALRSAAGGSAVVFAGWLGKLLVVDQAVRSVAVQGVLLVAAAVLCCGWAVRVLDDDEGRLRQEAR